MEPDTGCGDTQVIAVDEATRDIALGERRLRRRESDDDIAARRLADVRQRKRVVVCRALNAVETAHRQPQGGDVIGRERALRFVDEGELLHHGFRRRQTEACCHRA